MRKENKMQTEGLALEEIRELETALETTGAYVPGTVDAETRAKQMRMGQERKG